MKIKTKYKKLTKMLENITNIYEEEWQDIISLGNKMGITNKVMENNPIIILYLFYEYLEITK